MEVPSETFARVSELQGLRIPRRARVPPTARGSGARETDGRARSKAVREREPPARPHAKLPKPKTASGPFHFPRSREVWPPSWKPRPLGHYSRVGPCAGHLATEGLLGTPGSLRLSGNRQACGAAGTEQVKCSPWDCARPRTDLCRPRPNLHSRPPPESTHTAPRSAPAARPRSSGSFLDSSSTLSSECAPSPTLLAPELVWPVPAASSPDCYRYWVP